MAATVIGREDELRAIQVFLEEAAQGPRALVLSGEPGIGKTVLWEEGVEDAKQRSLRVLSHRSAEAEASLSFTALSDLLAPVFDEAAPSLAPLRRRALEVALLLAEPGEQAPDPRAIGLALLDVLRALGESGPVVVALDDLHWLDASSAGVLQIALRRLQDEPVRLLATVRRAPEVTASLELEAAVPEERLTRLVVGPLSLGALHRLLKERLGLELTRPELARVQEASAGNPFFALELGRELVRTDTRPEAGRALRVPESLHELLGGRLARLPTETGDVVLFAAALARPTVELVATAHGDRAGVLEALDTAAQEGVIELDDSRLRFAHPLLASICYEQAQAWKRHAVHRALADTVVDVEERARHMALSVGGPDAAVASDLDAAAEHAAARGATAAAADLAEQAAELTPADPNLALRRRLRAADFHRLAGEGERAAALLEQVLPAVPAGVDRADVLFALALTRTAGPPELLELCGQALAEAAGDDARCSRILAFRSWTHMFMGDVRHGLPEGRKALELAEQVGDPVLVATTIAQVGRAEGWAAETTPGLLERGIEIEERLGTALEYDASPRIVLGRTLIRFGQLDRARAILEEAETRAAGRGDELTRGLILSRLGTLEWFAGRLGLALEHAAAAVELMAQTAPRHSRGYAESIKALVEADLGLVEQARSSVERAVAFVDPSDYIVTIPALGVLGRIELAHGALDAAGDHLRDLPEKLLELGWTDPTNPVWPDTIETLVGLGELDQARAHLEQYELNARSLGSGWALASVARCRGLLAAGEGDLDASFDAFESSLAELEGLPVPLERARTLLCLGVVRRQAQQKRSAREALEGALEIFEQLGARLWADKARAELKRISGRAPASDELTESERRVAELAAKGHTNKQIAAELYMGQSTVEAHLSRVYRKLGVRRAGLAASLERVEA
jgi:DNA-binding CsgD family transcriptional regulator